MDEGILREGSRTYLWDGRIVEPPPEDPPHVGACERLRRLLDARLTEADWTIFSGHPVDIADGFLPQPDVAVLRGPLEAYEDRRPTPADTALLVEVVDRDDPDAPGDLLGGYAAHGIPQCWVVNIPERRVEVYAGPQPDRRSYRSRADYGPGGRIPLELTGGDRAPAFAGIKVDAILRSSVAGPGR
jgi:hypothetical protein